MRVEQVPGVSGVGSARHPTVLVAGSAHPELAAAVAARAAIEAVSANVGTFPDGELHVTVGPRVAGAHVCVLQPTGAPAERNLMELLLLVDACRRAGAATVDAVLPYLGYARQDRRTGPGDAVGVRVVLDTLAAGVVEHIVVVDPHTATLEAIATVPATVLTAVPVLAAALARELPPAAVLVAPDLGAVKLAERYADVLDLPVAVVRKTRISGTEVQARELVGDVDGRTAVIVDDMISTGATVEAAVHVVTSNGARPHVLVAATHGVLAGPARDVLGRLPIAHLVLTDTLAFDPDPLPRVEVVSVARLLADAICGLGSPAVPPPLARLGLEGIARHV